MGFEPLELPKKSLSITIDLDGNKMKRLKTSLTAYAAATVLISLSTPAFSAKSVVGTWYCNVQGTQSNAINGGAPQYSNYSYTAIRNFYPDHTSISVVNNESTLRMGTWSQTGANWQMFASVLPLQVVTQQACTAAGTPCVVNGATVSHTGRIVGQNILKNRINQSYTIYYSTLGQNLYIVMNADENCRRTSSKPTPKTLTNKDAVLNNQKPAQLIW